MTKISRCKDCGFPIIVQENGDDVCEYCISSDKVRSMPLNKISKRFYAKLEIDFDYLHAAISDVLDRLYDMSDVLIANPGDEVREYWSWLMRTLRDVKSLATRQGIYPLIPYILRYVPVTASERKVLESVSRKQWTSVRGKTTADKIKNLFNKVESLRETLEEVKEILYTKAKELSEREVEFVVDNMVVWNEGGFPDEQVKNIIGLLEQASDLLWDKGFGEFLYGDVYIVGNIHKVKSKAWYQPQTDNIFIRADIKKNLTDTLSFLHEVGHRVWRSSNVDKSYFEEYYNYLMNKVEGELPQVGESFSWSTRQDVEVLNYNPGNKVELLVKDKKKGDFKAVMTVSRMMDRYIDIAGNFVTPYASSDPEENFCEMFSFYIIGKLSTENKQEFLQGIND